VLGRLHELTDVALELRIEVVVLAIPRLEPETFRELVRQATAAGASVRYLPTFVAALERAVAGSDMRWLDVARLLGRDEIHVISPEAGADLADRVVVVTGAGGSIGSELCRQVFGFGPRRLVMLDHDESNLHRLQLELWGDGLLDNDDCVVADIRDRDRIDHLFASVKPDIVFHAAAHKHLPLLERHPCEAVKSNVRGTENVLWAAIKHEAEKFILISTDKAADPSSILGATKRLAEVLVQHEGGGETKVAAVRFGNVLGSRGSLLSVLAEQIQSGVPMTVTHPDMTRFFMTIEEAAGLVVEASHLANDGEIFVLDMGEPIRILDVVRSFATLMNRPDVQIRFTGMRPGEKLSETLFSEDERPLPTPHPRIYQTSGEHHVGGFYRKLRSLYDAAGRNDADAVRMYLRGLLPEFRPQSPTVPVQVAAPYADDY
jgi:FlaA1/EpsC-like NDP-sugar epimerase